ncbi:hypothetical protein NP493_757g00009 [Ridgeia piscesae]|uniref:Ig-like domain-containing protein n=1 Tax=Ridgeia piscesae TaxID=27915 RepID=A0AAD9KNQ3_RIDPI|nr:hypothetical protein NP493_757g00009 [Ridgeia piscesae]
MLCADGWHVCSSQDARLLKTITWKAATGVTGCFAFNAAQDTGECRPCLSSLEQDDLAGIGRGCPHQSYGHQSCITGGKIDVSCCVDTHFNRACTFRPGLASGVLCCQNPGRRPEILVHPKSFSQLSTGVTFVLSCRARGSPPPLVLWYKDGVLLPNGASRISVLDSGYLLVSETRLTDTGLYQCHATNSAGNDTANAKVIITDYTSGCADGSTEGLSQHEGVQACSGAWRGHVKRGRHLCARGWHVCSARHASALRDITWTEATSLDGCYAYNAANKLSSCSRCHRSDMAGIGSECGHMRHNLKSCLAVGRIDVLKGRTTVGGCNYREGVTTGVLCCKKIKKKEKYWDNLSKHPVIILSINSFSQCRGTSSPRTTVAPGVPTGGAVLPSINVCVRRATRVPGVKMLYAVVGAISTHSVSSRGSVDANPVTMVTNVSANLDVVRGSDVDDHAVMADDVDVDAASVLKHTMGQCVNTHQSAMIQNCQHLTQSGIRGSASEAAIFASWLPLEKKMVLL